MAWYGFRVSNGLLFESECKKQRILAYIDKLRTRWVSSALCLCVVAYVALKLCIILTSERCNINMRRVCSWISSSPRLPVRNHIFTLMSRHHHTLQHSHLTFIALTHDTHSSLLPIVDSAYMNIKSIYPFAQYLLTTFSAG